MKRFFPEDEAGWVKLQGLPNKPFVCGYCSTKVASVLGYALESKINSSHLGALYICPNCGGPTFFQPNGGCYPSPRPGNTVTHVPHDLEALYEEARRATAQNCFTGAVLLCRKMLMNIAVQQGAPEGRKFIEYVNFIAEKGYVPPNGRHWVDHIRTKGNEATHEIAVMSEQDAIDLIRFIEMLLRFIYEFPNVAPPKQ